LECDRRALVLAPTEGGAPQQYAEPVSARPQEWVRGVTTPAKTSVPVGMEMEGGVVSREQATARHSATVAAVVVRLGSGIRIG
jgi:hypothetical protein